MQVGLAGAQFLAGPEDHGAAGDGEGGVVGEHRVGEVVDGAGGVDLGEPHDLGAARSDEVGERFVLLNEG